MEFIWNNETYWENGKDIFYHFLIKKMKYSSLETIKDIIINSNSDKEILTKLKNLFSPNQRKVKISKTLSRPYSPSNQLSAPNSPLSAMSSIFSAMSSPLSAPTSPLSAPTSPLSAPTSPLSAPVIPLYLDSPWIVRNNEAEYTGWSVFDAEYLSYLINYNYNIPNLTNAYTFKFSTMLEIKPYLLFNIKNAFHKDLLIQ